MKPPPATLPTKCLSGSLPKSPSTVRANLVNALSTLSPNWGTLVRVIGHLMGSSLSVTWVAKRSSSLWLDLLMHKLSPIRIVTRY